ncbi:Iron hydrogenase maturase HydG [Carpediemonas membranifera]|uniref:Iron hydrogenase maturase HydG n=1 Tax=Carpediemonas membranifera TaxID=201153 RepID=A0A8J6E7I7_9EUKA|nr:Iron hydrogenase maturase HydG [Carpediemonas membranifera]|eukprot:KAG9390760.1 Iron hydrogenase maturase HydG [Carpediemonas membranifera]
MLSHLLRTNSVSTGALGGLLPSIISAASSSVPTSTFSRSLSEKTTPKLPKDIPYFLTKQMRQGSAWSPEKDLESLAKVPDPRSIIREDEINRLLEETKQDAKDPVKVRAILAKAYDNALLKTPETCNAADEFVQGLTLREAAILLNVDEEKEPDLMRELEETAFAIKEKIYGNRIVLFAPLYTANKCSNYCTYCGFNCENEEMDRVTLSTEEVIQDAKQIQRTGHKRILMLCGEHPDYTFDQFLDAVKAVSKTTSEHNGETRRINVEIPPVGISDMRRLKATDSVGTFTVFQETYHRETYDKFHLYGPKADYDWRVTVFDRCQLAGIDDVGLGALFGLYDYRFEVLGLLQHAEHLDKTYGAGPHTISIPRIQPAAGAPTSSDIPYPVNDKQFRKLVAVLRCAVPYTGMILSTRESPEMRHHLIDMGISQLSAGSRTEPGSYDSAEETHNDKEGTGTEGQFALSDTRTMDEIVRDLLERGFLPSWCTACYRQARTGETFMGFAKSGAIHNYCHPNGLLTLAEYLIDYASPKTAEAGWKLIEKETETITSEPRKKAFKRKLDAIKNGKRDLYF